MSIARQQQIIIYSASVEKLIRALVIEPNVSVAGNPTRFKESKREMRWEV